MTRSCDDFVIFYNSFARNLLHRTGCPLLHRTGGPYYTVRAPYPAIRVQNILASFARESAPACTRCDFLILASFWHRLASRAFRLHQMAACPKYGACPNVSKHVQTCPKYPCPNVSKRIQTCPNVSKRVQTVSKPCPNVSKRANKCTNLGRKFLTCPNRVQTCPKERRVQTCPNKY